MLKGCRIGEMVLEVPLINIRYSHCSNRCLVPVHCISFGSSVNVSSNKVSVVVVLVKNMFKVFVFVM